MDFRYQRDVPTRLYKKDKKTEGKMSLQPKGAGMGPSEEPKIILIQKVPEGRPFGSTENPFSYEKSRRDDLLVAKIHFHVKSPGGTTFW